jgi:hypothetical protein
VALAWLMPYGVIFYLWVLPLITAALGWAAAAATARIRPCLAVSVAAAPFTAPGWRRTAYVLLLFAVAVAALSGLAVGVLRG